MDSERIGILTGDGLTAGKTPAGGEAGKDQGGRANHRTSNTATDRGATVN